MAHKLGSLKYDPPSGKSTSSVAARVSDKPYTLEPNEAKIKSIAFDFSDSGSTLTVGTAKGKQVIKCGAGVWRNGTTNLFGDYPREVASGVWTSDDTFVATIRLYETPFVRTLTCHFSGDRLAVESKVNVNFVVKTDTLRGQLK